MASGFALYDEMIRAVEDWEEDPHRQWQCMGERYGARFNGTPIQAGQRWRSPRTRIEGGCVE